MATLQAVVDIQDRASSKFHKLTQSSNMFKNALIDLDHKLGEIERKIERITHKSISIKVDLDTSKLDAQFAALEARLMTAGHLGPDGFAMPAGGGGSGGGFGGGSGGGSARNVGNARKELRQGVSLQRLDNGVLGFVSTVFKALLNLGKVIDNIAEPLSRFFVKGLGMAQKFVGMFSESGAEAIGTLVKLAPAFATAAAGAFVLAAAAGVLVLLGTALAAVIGLIASALTSLLVPIAGIATGLAAIIGVIAFAIIPMVKWVSETKQLVDEKTKLNERLRYLTKGSKEYNTTLAKRDELQQKLNKSGAEGIFTTMQTVMEDLKKVIFTDENKKTWVDTLNAGLEALRPLLPIVSFLANQFSYAVKGVAEKFRDFTASGEGRMLILSFFASSIPLVEKFASALGAMVRIFMAIGVAAAPIVNKMMGDFVGWLSQTADYLSSPEGLKSLGGFFDTMYPVFKGLVELLSAFIGGVRDIGVALAPELSSVISWLREFGGTFVKWVIETVKKYGPMLARWLKIIGGVIAVMWDAVTKVYDILKPVFEFFTNVIEIALKAYQNFMKFEEAIGVFELLGTVIAVLFYPINLVLEVVKTLLDWIGELFDWLSNSDAAQAIGEVWGSIFGWINDTVSVAQTLIGVLKDVWGWLTSVFSFGDSTLALPAAPDGSNITAGPNGFDVQFPSMSGGSTNPLFGGPTGASGAIVTQPTRALIGEAGPEAVVPLNMTRGSRRLKLGAEGGTHISGDIHVHGVQNLQQFISEVQKHIANMPRESGSGMSVG